ncbi:MAG: pirin family protein [Flavobacteriales bacterium]|jgi:hypothetical protein|nr:pirin family protein [Flavobacteriales bacterium]
MNRKTFLRNGVLGGTALAALGKAVGTSASPEVVGFDHLPNENTHIMKNMVLHRASTRGHADHGWLQSHHSFSFASYYDPARMHFGTLRVLNDDVIAPGRGFGTHPHENMEIVTIPLSGTVAHKDSLGNSGTIKAGEVQVMSAGTGITHSEFNHGADAELRLLQTWMFPKQRNVEPRYAQIQLDHHAGENGFQQVLSPHPDDAGVWVHQDAWFHLGRFEAHREIEYHVKRKGNGVYAFLIDGEATINGQALFQRDGLGVWDVESLSITTGQHGARILLMDVPMELA